MINNDRLYVEIPCTKAALIKMWNCLTRTNRKPITCLAMWFAKIQSNICVESIMSEIIRSYLNGEEWRKFKSYWQDRDKKFPIVFQLIRLCSRFKIALPFNVSYESYKWDEDLAKTFWEKINLNCYMSEDLVNRFHKNSSKSGKEWKTEGNPDSYDMNKILEDLGEVSLENKKKSKNKNKKNRKSKNPEQQNSIETKSKPSNPLKNSTSNDTNKEVAKPSITIDPEFTVKDQAPLKVEFDSVQEYIDSLEQDVRCLKMSQQFYDSMEKENQKLKKAYDNMKKGFEALVDSKLCKVCMDEDACIVFIPCGHLMSCVNCSPSLKNCAICRRPVKSSIRTYFS